MVGWSRCSRPLPRVHLGKGFRTDPSASTKLLAIHLQCTYQTVALHPASLVHKFRKRSIEMTNALNLSFYRDSAS
ncbi:hypothetical protein SAMN00790413_06609 [Deinococcus hopiensis KR-140]|uniref:Uncharacterized protein n=1 Tax=Deinococcus hopiensis KR-140 TaxID=695939 RepID=A0A1W1UB70_9DEIO|nr:hypothetical protein SAMN00790413_06609 [Deinococcus hopiensis KR-140]